MSTGFNVRPYLAQHANLHRPEHRPPTDNQTCGRVMSAFIQLVNQLRTPWYRSNIIIHRSYPRQTTTPHHQPHQQLLSHKNTILNYTITPLLLYSTTCTASPSVVS